MNKKIIINTEKDNRWRKSLEHGNLRWKLLIDSSITKSSDLSVGLLKIIPNEQLALHHHSPKEIYLIKKGAGLLLTPNKSFDVKSGDLVFIPEDAIHGVKNTCKIPMLIYWIFPTNCWEQVKYNFVT